jgi:hypothetical protein
LLQASIAESHPAMARRRETLLNFTTVSWLLDRSLRDTLAWAYEPSA